MKKFRKMLQNKNLPTFRWMWTTTMIIGLPSSAAFTEHRKRADWANQIKRLVDGDFPDAEKIVLVMDNLNIHNITSL
jgi:hypothetical protein